MRFSSIIPTLNEETRIGQLIRYLSWVAARADEILVVDGGSSDVTRAEAALAGASQVLSSMRSGRSAPDFFEQIETARAAGCDCASNGRRRCCGSTPGWYVGIGAWFALATRAFMYREWRSAASSASDHHCACSRTRRSFCVCGGYSVSA